MVGTVIAVAILNLMQLGDPAAGERKIYYLVFFTFLRFPLREISAALPACMPGEG
ncbi:MAG TPA: hypothetical protein PK669_08495 [Methanosarcina thermophila]|uniref:hypothetical protein n=1 Tax=Methanosarcina thermophila TaxID=2210 RepID=UPI000A47107C|nr:hypothetical protein [Methanosarcina thermophila]NLU57774.1 hypothetical protein [Methanosarcina thermophila]HOA69233.1 hypothetical protein [Methanosarcina thermophila]HOQ65927.1 hypothetical protein [Methanosarcina thermophila]HPT81239.1 hypothetical protein [Methanosarcina thermophila]HPZ20333.1 hypothetical protein [Methanosarcina thermophila]